MLITTLLNKVNKLKGFVYCQIIEDINAKVPTLIIKIRPRTGHKHICSVCQTASPGYDTLPVRQFQFIPLWGYAVFFKYAMRRVSCPRCSKVVVEQVPWAVGKERLTDKMAWYLAHWSKKMSWSEVSTSFGTSWHHVYKSVEMAVKWGRAHVSIEGITAIGVDEVAYRKNHKYLTLMYQINHNSKRLIWIGVNRTKDTLRQGFDWLNNRPEHLSDSCYDGSSRIPEGLIDDFFTDAQIEKDDKEEEIIIDERDYDDSYLEDPLLKPEVSTANKDIVSRCGKIRYVCSDMWRPYLNVISEKACNAMNILDRYHIVSHMNKALDKVRNAEVRDLLSKGLEPILNKSRWLLLKNKENLNVKQRTNLKDLLRCNLKTVKAYILKEEFHLFWEYDSPYFASKFLDLWCAKVQKTKIEPMKRVAKMLVNHRELILNWFKAKKEFSSGVVEGLNNVVKSVVKRAYGFHTQKAIQVALYHKLGGLPEPEFSHKFF
jgi:transposase